ncbi:MAG: hypothetical protein ON057_001262 [Glomeribacter sp. 1016415]|nr:hypothetical protein [Glomeribacter sp. 1016415]
MLSQNLGVAVKFGSGAKTRTRADFAGEFKERLENMRQIFVNLVKQKRKLRCISSDLIVQ